VGLNPHYFKRSVMSSKKSKNQKNKKTPVETPVEIITKPLGMNQPSIIDPDVVASQNRAPVIPVNNDEIFKFIGRGCYLIPVGKKKEVVKFSEEYGFVFKTQNQELAKILLKKGFKGAD